MTEHTKPETIEEALLQVSPPAKKYYRDLAPFIRGYNIAHNNEFDFEQFKKDLPLIFELASVGLITWVNVATVHPCDDHAEIRERTTEPSVNQTLQAMQKDIATIAQMVTNAAQRFAVKCPTPFSKIPDP